MDTVTFTKTVVIPIADADGVAIREGSVLQHISEKDRGVVVRISRAGDRAVTFLEQVGDLAIQTSRGSTRFSNQYGNWRHVPQKEQTHEERFLSWLKSPRYHDTDRCKNESEDKAISGIMALLPEDIINWDYDSGPYSLEDALAYLVRHLGHLSNSSINPS